MLCVLYPLGLNGPPAYTPRRNPPDAWIFKMAESDWIDHQVPKLLPSTTLVEEFKDHIDDARDERPIQEFLARHPVLLRPLLPEGQEYWCFDRPRFGSEYIPDLLLCTRNSSGYHWILIELESPSKAAIVRDGRRSADLAEALRQVDEWRIWLRQNIQYAQTTLAFTDIDAESPAVIVIGRRHRLMQQHTKRYRELSSPAGRLSVMTYDRLLESARDLAVLAGSSRP